MVGVMEILSVLRHRLPERVQIDNASEFISKTQGKWACENGMVMEFTRPGKPIDNALIESFIGSLRDECLNIAQ